MYPHTDARVSATNNGPTLEHITALCLTARYMRRWMTSIRANGTNQADWPTGIYISAGKPAAAGCLQQSQEIRTRIRGWLRRRSPSKLAGKSLREGNGNRTSNPSPAKRFDNDRFTVKPPASRNSHGNPRAVSRKFRPAISFHAARHATLRFPDFAVYDRPKKLLLSAIPRKLDAGTSPGWQARKFSCRELAGRKTFASLRECWRNAEQTVYRGSEGCNTVYHRKIAPAGFTFSLRSLLIRTESYRAINHRRWNVCRKCQQTDRKQSTERIARVPLKLTGLMTIALEPPSSDVLCASGRARAKNGEESFAVQLWDTGN